MHLVLSGACEDVRTRPDGRIDLIGVFNELSAPGFPAMQDRMTVIFIIEWSGAEIGEQPLRADLLDPNDEQVLTIQGHTEVTARGADIAPAQTRLILPLEKVIFPTPGRYRFVLRAGQAEPVHAFWIFLSRKESDPSGRGRV